MRKTYDYIIVGGGSAGAVVAARLSEIDGVRILLLEAGPNFQLGEFPDELTDPDIIGSPHYDWGYKSIKGYIGHKIKLPRAKVIGGCSAHNACAAVRARSANFDIWSAKIKNWTYEDVLPYYEKLEKKFPIEIGQVNNTFVDSIMMLGYEYIENLNKYDKDKGVGPLPVNIVNDERQNTAMVYLTESVRSKIKIIGFAEVDRVIIENGIANGVVLFCGDVFRARREIIVCAGTFGSCEILARSGIDSVGKTLYDHPFYYNVYKLRDGAEEIEDMALLDSDIFIVAFSDSNTLTLTLGIGLTQPVSCGSYLNGKIDLNFLHEEYDRKRMVNAVKLAREITRTGPLGELILHEIEPGENIVRDEQLEEAIIENIDSFGHPTSTIPMGDILDEYCRVIGKKNLRVVDASVFPYPVSCPPNVTIIMIAEKISDHIKMDFYNFKKIDN